MSLGAKLSVDLESGGISSNLVFKLNGDLDPGSSPEITEEKSFSVSPN